MKIFSFYLTWIAMCWMLASSTLHAETSANSIQVMVETINGQAEYRIDGAVVRGKNLMEASEEKARTLGIKTQVDIILDINTSFAVMFDLTGMFGKIGFEKVNCYVIDKYRRTMVEISRGRGNIPVPGGY